MLAASRCPVGATLHTSCTSSPFRDEYDALGREVQHVTPWKATTATAYKGLSVEVTDPLLNVTLYDLDALGRPVTITDAMKGSVHHIYTTATALR